GARVHHGQRSRKPEAHGTDERVGLGAKTVGAGAEELALGAQLDVHFEPDHGLPPERGRALGYGSAHEGSSGQRRSPPSAPSSAAPRRKSVPSPSAALTSWIPTGNPSAVNPHGTLSAGMPARLAPIVKMSERYMARGSVAFSPILNAGVGEVGRRS